MIADSCLNYRKLLFMLNGSRLTLRAITDEDLPHYVAWLTDAEVTAHLLTFMPMNLDDEMDWYEGQRRDRTVLNLAMVVRAEDKHIGSISLQLINHRAQSAELGIVIGDKPSWGQGYGQEAIGLLLDFAFQELNLHRIYLHVDVSHVAGIQCYKKCSFVEEGRLRDATYHHGDFEDQFLMSVLRSEYKKNRS